MLLDGRNAATLRDWLKNHKNIKVVTHDRASVYAKVISEELPDAMQVADRFHLHQNFLFIVVIRRFGNLSAVSKNFELFLENEMFFYFTCL